MKTQIIPVRLDESTVRRLDRLARSLTEQMWEFYQEVQGSRASSVRSKVSRSTALRLAIEHGLTEIEKARALKMKKREPKKVTRKAGAKR